MTAITQQILRLIDRWPEKDQAVLLEALQQEERRRLARAIDQRKGNEMPLDLEAILQEVWAVRGITNG